MDEAVVDGKNGAGSARAGARHSRGPARRPHDQNLRLPLSFIVALAPSFHRSFLQIPGACALRRHPRCRKIRRSRISRCGRSRSSLRALTRPEGKSLSLWRGSSQPSSAHLATVMFVAISEFRDSFQIFRVACSDRLLMNILELAHL